MTQLDRRDDRPAGLDAGSGISQDHNPLPPNTACTWWLSDGRAV